MNRKLILIVEDDAAIRDTLKEYLLFEGYEVQSAPDGREALDYLTQKNRLPNLILLDLMMPVCSGIEFLKCFRTHKDLPIIPIIVMSAAADAEDTAREFRTEFIRKPLDADELVASLNRLI